MLFHPVWRSAPMARLRKVAMARGALPVRIWDRSSSNVVPVRMRSHGVQGIGGDHGSGQIQTGQQSLEPGGFVSL